MSNTILTKKYYDLGDEAYYIASNLVVKADPDDPKAGLKPYVQWSKTTIEPLEAAIEQLVQRVRDDTKAGNKVFTRAEQAKLNDLAAELRVKTTNRCSAAYRVACPLHNDSSYNGAEVIAGLPGLPTSPQYSRGVPAIQEHLRRTPDTAGAFRQ
jgi:hypothetical protein